MHHCVILPSGALLNLDQVQFAEANEDRTKVTVFLNGDSRYLSGEEARLFVEFMDALPSFGEFLEAVTHPFPEAAHIPEGPVFRSPFEMTEYDIGCMTEAGLRDPGTREASLELVKRAAELLGERLGSENREWYEKLIAGMEAKWAEADEKALHQPEDQDTSLPASGALGLESQDQAEGSAFARLGGLE